MILPDDLTRDSKHRGKTTGNHDKIKRRQETKWQSLSPAVLKDILKARGRECHSS